LSQRITVSRLSFFELFGVVLLVRLIARISDPESFKRWPDADKGEWSAGFFLRPKICMPKFGKSCYFLNFLLTSHTRICAKAQSTLKTGNLEQQCDMNVK